MKPIRGRPADHGCCRSDCVEGKQRRGRLFKLAKRISLPIRWRPQDWPWCCKPDADARDCRKSGDFRDGLRDEWQQRGDIGLRLDTGRTFHLSMIAAGVTFNVAHNPRWSIRVASPLCEQTAAGWFGDYARLFFRMSTLHAHALQLALRRRFSARVVPASWLLAPPAGL